MATISKEDLTRRANDELAAASDALFRVRALLRAVEVAIDGAESPRLDDIASLVATGIEVATQYAERAGDEASFFGALDENLASTSRGGTA
ncbi:hypothetical protein [Paraburkholderia bannensis]|uniref:hypothetical protein n=1 Tax=Paraburkholderia bannensis TaxID=765414 RepID=UPI002AC35270|nr:hypothetical protein [Paraburkholderia bannensis]